MMRMNRRQMLEVLGLAGATTLGGGLGGPRSGFAAAAPVPKRIVFFFTEQGSLRQLNPDGTLKPLWVPATTGAPDPLKIQTPWATDAFTFRDMHQPLVPFQKQIMVLDGLDMMSNDSDPIGATNAHVAGETHALIGANRQSDSLAGGISIDQFIAKGLNSPTPLTQLSSLECFVDGNQSPGGGEQAPLYAAAGQPIPITGDVKAVYARLFPNGAGTVASSADAVKMAQQKSVLDHAAVDFSNLAATMTAKMGRLDAARLSAHAAAIRDLESRLSLGAVSSCTQPGPEMIATASHGGGAAYNAPADVHMRLVQTALACDLTRVATLYLTQAPNENFGYQANMAGTTDFHDMVHKTCGQAAAGKSVPPLGDDPQAMSVVKAYHSYNAGLFAKFLGLLQAIPQSDGTTLLDNTLVVWCGQLAGGDHSLDRVPYLLGGGLGGAVKTGRYVMLPRKASSRWPVYSDGIPHNNLLVSLANLMGVRATTFGNPAVCTGPLSQVFA